MIRLAVRLRAALIAFQAPSAVAAVIVETDARELRDELDAVKAEIAASRETNRETMLAVCGAAFGVASDVPRRPEGWDGASGEYWDGYDAAITDFRSWLAALHGEWITQIGRLLAAPGDGSDDGTEPSSQPK